jgi:uncharacterized membrane protein
VRRFYENRTVRGLALVALIALIVVVLSHESVLAASGAATSKPGRTALGVSSTAPSCSP